MKENIKASIIIVWNNEEQLNEAKKWLSKQTIYSETEVILLDNRGNANYKSAASALNAGGAKPVVIF